MCLGLWIGLAGLLSGCQMPRPGTPASTLPGLAAAYTQAAQTVEARFTLTAIQAGLAPATPIPAETRPPATPFPTQAIAGGYTPAALPDTPRPTPTPEVAPLEPTLTPLALEPSATLPLVATPAATALAPTPPLASADCNRMDWIGDVTVPADTVFPAGSSFTKVWRVRNAGTCTWSSDYALVFAGGNLPGSVNTVFLPFSIAPGQTADLSMTLIAPPYPALYQSSWMLRDPQGRLFGYGPGGAGALTVRIQTYQPTAPHPYAFDLVSYACSGSWRSAVGPLICPGGTQDRSGTVILLSQPNLETGLAGDYGLWTRPNRAVDGWISGEMPAYAIQSGDHFLADLGCLADNPACDVTFQLDYRTADGRRGGLGRWRETSDGATTSVDLDLSQLAGQATTLVLTVNNNGEPRQANAVWLLPRIQKLNAARAYTLVWTREGFPSANSCDGLRISLVGPRTALAQAFDCRRASSPEIGRTTLTVDQANQLWIWVQRYQNYEGEVYTSTSQHPVIAWIQFQGLGQNVAGEAEIQAMNSFALQIFSQIGP